jgi:hypothetical protein
MTYGKVQETIITGSTANKSHICEFGWYDWVMFRDNVPTFPDDKKTLATWWMVSPERAQWIVQQTMQRGVHTCLNSMLAQQFPTNDGMRHYKRLPHNMFTDTLFAGTPSHSGNKCFQAFLTSFGWARVHPMTQTVEAQETLFLLFHRDGVPPTMIFDGSKEQFQGELKNKLCKAECHSRQTEPYSPLQQATEGCIRNLKRGVSQKMIKTRSPKVFMGPLY